MEYRLNKIDKELISKVKSTTAPSKIHKEEKAKLNSEDERKNNRYKYSMGSYKKEIKKEIEEERLEDGTGKFLYVRK